MGGGGRGGGVGRVEKYVKINSANPKCKLHLMQWLTHAAGLNEMSNKLPKKIHWRRLKKLRVENIYQQRGQLFILCVSTLMYFFFVLFEQTKKDRFFISDVKLRNKRKEKERKREREAGIAFLLHQLI